ncbi:MAG: xanthine dehydrogenase family protein subunit M [Leptospirales bacterium]|nr:xanthine dehydrogenase family protein subunit M [Leptospirales bacterium]
MIQDFTYLKPESVKEALSMLSEHGEAAHLICGGQSLLIVMREGMVTTDYLVDIKHLKELDYIKFDAKDGLRLGATTTHRSVEHSDVVKKNYHALWEVEERLANGQIRNWGSIGGNIAHADPAEDPATVYLAYDAEITLQSAKGSRTMSVDDFLVGFYENAAGHDEMVTEIHLPAPEPKTGSAFTKFTLLENDLGVASVTARVTLDGSGKCKSVGIALGCVGDKTLRAKEAEALLVGKDYDEKLFEQAGKVASENCSPNADIHATEDTRRQEVYVLTKRMLKKAWERAKEA